nr:cytochrome P450 CYP749A22-like [Malus domestica]
MTGEADGFGSDYLGILLKARHDAHEKQRISVDDLVEECKTFYFAGHETTNSLLAWTVFLLALHTDWQGEARKEMGMIINESLRLYPPAVSLTRESLKEVRLGQVVVPANVELHVTNLALHHEPKYWGKDMQLFKPERFSKGVAKATNNNAVAFILYSLTMMSMQIVYYQSQTLDYSFNQLSKVSSFADCLLIFSPIQSSVDG